MSASQASFAPRAPFIDLSIRPATEQGQRRRMSASIATRGSNEATARYNSTARAIGLHPLPRSVAIDDESARWSAFLDMLRARVAAGSVTSAQRSMLLSIWKRACTMQPSLRRPAVGVSEDGLLNASWSFLDMPGRAFSLQVHPDGVTDWFFRDAATETSRGSDDTPPRELPAEAFELLAAGFGTSTPGSR